MSILESINRDTENGKYDWFIDEYLEQKESIPDCEEENDGFIIGTEEDLYYPAEPVLCPWTGTILNP